MSQEHCEVWGAMSKDIHNILESGSGLPSLAVFVRTQGWWASLPVLRGRAKDFERNYWKIIYKHTRLQLRHPPWLSSTVTILFPLLWLFLTAFLQNIYCKGRKQVKGKTLFLYGLSFSCSVLQMQNHSKQGWLWIFHFKMVRYQIADAA